MAEPRTRAPKTTVKIHFADAVAADHFLSWLCGAGEQDYWEWMRCREEDESGPITAVVFDYHKPNGGKFGPQVTTTCARLDEDE